MKENLNEKIKKFLKTQIIILPVEEINQIVLEVVKNNRQVKGEQVLTILKTSIDQKNQEYVADEKNLIAVLNRFIDENLQECLYPYAIKEVNKLINFVERLNVELSLQVADEINNNPKFFKLISQIMTHQNFEEELTGEVWTILLTSYCLANNVGLDQNTADLSEASLYNLDAYMREIASFSVLTNEEEKQLGREILKGNKEAENKLIKHNLRLVVFIAKRNLNRGLDLTDLISFGNMGLMKAAHMYDSEKDNKFSTYAGWWINSYINLGLFSTANNIRIPNHVMEYKRRYLKVKNQIEAEYGREATVEEVMQKTGFSPKLIAELDALATTVSFNSKLSEESETELLDYLVDDENQIEQLMVQQSLAIKIRELLENTKLNEMERNVIFYRYGFFDNEVWTLEKIAKKYQKTRERIRQIEAKALKKIRMNPKIKNFLIFAQNYNQAETNLENYIAYYSQDKTYQPKKEIIKSNSTLFDFLNISPQELPKILAKLYPEEEELVIKRFGSDFCTLNTTNWSKEDARFFNSYVRKVLERIVKNSNYERKQIPKWIIQKRQNQQRVLKK